MKAALASDAKLSERRQRALESPYKPERDTSGRFLPGFTGNRLGQPPSFADYIRRSTTNGLDLINQALQCVRGSIVVRWEDENGELHERIAPSSARDQAEARQWLTENGLAGLLSKVVEKDDRPDLSRLSFHEARLMFALLQKADGRDDHNLYEALVRLLHTADVRSHVAAAQERLKLSLFGLSRNPVIDPEAPFADMQAEPAQSLEPTVDAAKEGADV